MSFESQIAQILDERSLSGKAQVRLASFAALVSKWNPSINIVARSTIPDVWTRHILDSAQLIRVVSPATRVWADLGSGGGFPGIVIAILAADLHKDLRVTLVESDKRKCVFLSEAARLLNLDLDIVADRIETASPIGADIVSARALAPLPLLCSMASYHLKDGGTCVFPKGQNSEAEVVSARLAWRFDLESIQSITDERASLLVLKGLQHV